MGKKTKTIRKISAISKGKVSKNKRLKMQLSKVNCKGKTYSGKSPENGLSQKKVKIKPKIKSLPPSRSKAIEEQDLSFENQIDSLISVLQKNRPSIVKNRIPTIEEKILDKLKEVKHLNQEILSEGAEKNRNDESELGEGTSKKGLNKYKGGAISKKKFITPNIKSASLNKESILKRIKNSSGDSPVKSLSSNQINRAKILNFMNISKKNQNREEKSDFLTTYNMIKIQNPKQLAQRTAKLDLVKQTLLNTERLSEASKKNCLECGLNQSPNHKRSCEKRKLDLEHILKNLKVAKSSPKTPEKEQSLSSAFKASTNLLNTFESLRELNGDNELQLNTSVESGKLLNMSSLSPRKSPRSTKLVREPSAKNTPEVNGKYPSPDSMSKSTYRSLCNLYKGLDNEHINIILSAPSNERSLRSRSQEKELSSDNVIDTGGDVVPNEIIITTRISGNTIERKTLIRPVQSSNEKEPQDQDHLAVNDNGDVTDDIYKELDKSRGYLEDRPQRELISDCPQGLPKSAKVKKLLKRNVLNPIKFRASIDGFGNPKKSTNLKKRTKSKDDRRDNNTELNAEENLHPLSKVSKKKFLKECKTQWQIEKIDFKQENVEFLSKKKNEDPGLLLSELEDEEYPIVGDQVGFVPYTYVPPVVDSSKDEQVVPTQPEVVPTQPEPKELVNDVSPVENMDTFSAGDSFYESSGVYSSLSDFINHAKKTLPNTHTPSSQTRIAPCYNRLGPNNDDSSQLSSSSSPESKRQSQLLLKQEILEEIRKLEDRRWCSTCERSYANLSTLKLHFTSSMHMKNVEKKIFGDGKENGNRSAQKRNPKQPYIRKQSGKDEVSDEEDTDDVTGDEEFPSKENSGEVKTTTPSVKKYMSCTVCKLDFSSKSLLNKHFATNMHKTAAVMLATKLEDQGLIKTALFS